MSAPHDLRPSPAAQQVADRLRSGVSARLESSDASLPDEERARLEEAGDLESLRPAAKSHALAPVVRSVRYGFRILLRPWSAAQSAFNRLVARRLVDTEAATHAIDRRLDAIEHALLTLDARVRALEASHDSATHDAVTLPSSDAGLRALEWMFLHSRLPAPPARVLAFGDAGLANRVQELGFRVFVVGGRESAASGPPGSAADPNALPFASATFDAAIVTVADAAHQGGSETIAPVKLAEVARVLKPGGRLLLGVPVVCARTLGAFDGFVLLDALSASPDGRVRPWAGGALDAREGALFVYAERA